MPCISILFVHHDVQTLVSYAPASLMLELIHLCCRLRHFLQYSNFFSVQVTLERGLNLELRYPECPHMRYYLQRLELELRHLFQPQMHLICLMNHGICVIVIRFSTTSNVRPFCHLNPYSSCSEHFALYNKIPSRYNRLARTEHFLRIESAFLFCAGYFATCKRDTVSNSSLPRSKCSSSISSKLSSSP